MTTDRELERMLDRWLAEGDDTVDGRLIEDIGDRIGRQSQLPAWRVSWRDTPMNGLAKPLSALAAVVLLAVAGFAMIGRPADQGISGPTAQPPSRIPSTAPSPTAPWTTADQCGQPGGPECGGPMSAGTYTARNFRPAITYTLGTGWVNVFDGPRDYLLYPDTPANRAIAAGGDHPPHIMIASGPLAALPDARLIGPPTDEAVCAGDRPGSSPGPLGDSVEMSAAEFAEYLTTQNGLAVTEPVSITVGGLSGQQLDAVPQAGMLTCLPGTPFGAVIAQTDSYRYVLLDDVAGDAVMITLWAPSDFEAFVGPAMRVVRTFEFDIAP